MILGFLTEAFLINSHYEEYFQVQTAQAEEMEKPAKVSCSESMQNIIVYKQILQLNWPHCIPHDVRKQIFQPILSQDFQFPICLHHSLPEQ